MSTSVQMYVDADSTAVCARVARAMVTATRETTNEHCTWVLSGGRTPRKLYRLLASEYRQAIPWEMVHVFWGDERCVPPEDPDSNFALAQQTLLRHVPLRSEQVHRMAGELSPPEGAAAYEQHLQQFFAMPLSSVPVFDIMLLGMGPDGHTASLFPGASTLQERARWVVDAHASNLQPAWRMTLTPPVLCAARKVWFVVTGADKAPVVRQILADVENASARYPAAQMLRAAPHAQWFCDAAAAGKP